MADINILGHKVKPVTAGAIVVGSGVAIWFAVKQHQSSASSSSTSASAIDPVTGLPYSQDNTTDPLTGMSYLAEAQEYGSVQAAEQAVAGESSLDYSNGGYSTGSGYYTGTSTGTDGNTSVVQGTTYGSNAAWAQAVEAGLTDIGYSSTDVAAALGRYLGNLSETSAQATIVQAAIAEYGPPPVGSYQIIMAPSTGPTGSGGGTTTDYTVPNVVHLDAANAEQVLSSAGFKASGVPAAVSGIVHYVTAQSPAAGSKEVKGTTVKLTIGVAVPNVVGQSQSAAFGVLSKAGLHAKGSPTVKGKTLKVESESPAAGTIVKTGTTVTLRSKVS